MCITITILSVGSLNLIMFAPPLLNKYAIMPLKKRKFQDEDGSVVSRNKSVTEGDANVKTIRMVSNIQELSDLLSGIINQHGRDQQSRAKPRESFTLIQDLTMCCLNEGVKCITTYQKKKVWYILQYHSQRQSLTKIKREERCYSITTI